MADKQYEFLESELSQGITNSAFGRGDIGVGTGSSLRFSSPWPWVRAVVVSLLLWAGLAMLIWILF